jgi:MtrB/PioB family decaheme-associated outer membrane protein
MTGTRQTALVLGLLLALSAWNPAPGSAQTPLPGGTGFADVELGLRFLLQEPAATELARFHEYRDLRSGPVVPRLRAWYDSDDGRQRVELLARYPGQTDGSLLLRGTRLGLLRWELERDRTRHVFSTNGRLLGTSPERGVLTLPTPRPGIEAFNAAPLLGQIATHWTQDRALLTLAPSTAWSVAAEYSQTRKRGDRPMGMAYGTAGNNHREVLEPIEHTTHHVRVAPSIRRAGYQLQASYDYSAFENSLSAMVADNPLVATDQATAGSARGRTALAPGNQAHTLALQGAVTLPLRARVGGTVSYGIRQQREAFLPYTINSAISTDGLSPLPAHLDGDVRTLLVRFSGSMRPTPAVSLGARFRHYELDDRTPAIALAGRVVNDRTLSVPASPLERHRYPYARQSAGVDMRWRIAAPVALQLDYGYDEWKRDLHVREVTRTAEHTPRVVLDITPTDWLAIRSSYLRSQRRGDDYQEWASAQLPLLRKHDVADRDRERLDLSADVTTWPTLNFGASLAFGTSEYPDSPYGRSRDADRAAGVHAVWTPDQRVTMNVSVLRETFEVRQRSRYRVPPAQLDNESYDWVGNTDDEVLTAGLGITATVLPRRLDVGLGWDRVHVTSTMRALNPTAPTGGTDGQNAAAVGTDFPDITYTLTPASAWIRYRLGDNWSVNARYGYERFEQVDFRVDGLVPGTGADILMGNDLENYRSQVLTVGIRFAPRIPGVPIV